MLRIEAEQHTAVIWCLDLDWEGHYLATGSDDKTARVWALPEGRLLRVLRPQAGPGDEGKVGAVALTPDGGTVALGGWTSPSGTDEVVYLFDRETGRLLRRLGGLEKAVNLLAFSPGGEYLAASLGGGKGVRVWGTRDWEEVFADREYGDRSQGCTFDRAGRLATTCLDGLLRLYRPAKEAHGFRLLRKIPAPGGERPFTIAFSPDGERLAVGYDDTTAVSVLSGADLSALFSPDTAGIDNGDLASVAWSADGRFLYAGGEYEDSSGGCPIFRWDEGGKGESAQDDTRRHQSLRLRPILSLLRLHCRVENWQRGHSRAAGRR